MKKRMKGLALIVAFLTFGLAQAQNGNGNGNGNSNNGFTVVNSTESESFTMDFTHPCTGDVIMLTGTRHISSHGKAYPDGSDDIKTSINESASGTDVNGYVYNYSRNSTNRFSFGPPVCPFPPFFCIPGSGTLTFSEVSNVAGTGGAPNAHLNVETTVTRTVTLLPPFGFSVSNEVETEVKNATCPGN